MDEEHSKNGLKDYVFPHFQKLKDYERSLQGQRCDFDGTH